MDYAELINDVFELECKLFMKMDSYHLIEKNAIKNALLRLKENSYILIFIMFLQD
ncbi:MAG: hypothetical protein LUH15_08315 [Tannerellaceae bacterium]|nr:hypothetical protein [Tannerellaceae bacterium]